MGGVWGSGSRESRRRLSSWRMRLGCRVRSCRLVRPGAGGFVSGGERGKEGGGGLTYGVHDAYHAGFIA